MSQLDAKTRRAIASVRVRRFLARWGVLLAVALFAVALYYAIVACMRREEDIRSTAWPTTTGTVIDTEYPADDAEDPRRASIRYRYQAGDETYESDRVTLHSTWPPPDLREEHPKGSEVTVYYNPENPDFAVLEPGADSKSDVAFAYPTLLSLVLLVLVAEAVKTRRLITLVRGGRARAIRELLRGNLPPAAGTEAVLLAANLPDPGVFSLLVPFVGNHRLRVLAVYAEHQGTPWMRERLQSAVADRVEHPPMPETREDGQAPKAPFPRVPAWLDPLIERFASVYEELTPLSGFVVVTVGLLFAATVSLVRLFGRTGTWLFFAIGSVWLITAGLALYRVQWPGSREAESRGPQPGDQSFSLSAPAQGKPHVRFSRLIASACSEWGVLCVFLGGLFTLTSWENENDFGIRRFGQFWIVVSALIASGLPFCLLVAAMRYWTGAGVDDASEPDAARPPTASHRERAGRFRRLVGKACIGWGWVCVFVGALFAVSLFAGDADFELTQLFVLWIVVFAGIALGLPFCLAIAAIRYWAGADTENDGAEPAAQGRPTQGERTDTSHDE